MAFSRYLYRGPGFRLGEMRCPPDDLLWAEECCEDNPLLGFPETSVWITKAQADPAVADVNGVVFHNPGRPYRRSLLDPAGYACSFLALDPGLFLEVRHDLALGRERVGGDRFPAEAATVHPATYLLKYRLLRHLRSGQPVDRLFVEEATLVLLRRSISGSVGGWPPPRGAMAAVRPHTRRAWAQMAEAAKAELAARFADDVSLRDLGVAVHSSSYHLARIFRSRTGRSLHEYRNNLRLRRSLEYLGESRDDIASIGLGLGFSSHSHFTVSFRRLFGMSPSEVRRAATRNRSHIRELRTRIDPSGVG